MGSIATYDIYEAIDGKLLIRLILDDFTCEEYDKELPLSWKSVLLNNKVPISLKAYLWKYKPE